MVKSELLHEQTPETMRSMGLRVRRRREELGLTLRETALRAGLSVPYIANLEKARGNPTLDTLVRLSDALELALVDLVGD